MTDFENCPEVPTGNTINPVGIFFNKTMRTRWIPSFTSFLDTEPHFDETLVKFLSFGLETCPKTGKKHYQGCAYFYDKVSPSMAQKILKIPKQHIENIPRHDDKMKAIKYTQKEGNFKQFGIIPEQGKRTDLDQIKNEIVAGKKVDEIILERPMMYHQYGRTLDRIETIMLRKKWRSWMTKGIWYFGKTGVGKSRKVFEDYDPEQVYEKNLTEDFWDGYKGQPIVILNEFRGQIKFEELLDLVDMHPKRVKIKGKEPVPFLAKEVRITSSLHPREIYCQSLSKNDRFEQFERRFEIVEL